MRGVHGAAAPSSVLGTVGPSAAPARCPQKDKQGRGSCSAPPARPQGGSSEGTATEGQPILKESGCSYLSRQASAHLLCSSVRVRTCTWIHNDMCVCACVHARVPPSLGLCGAECAAEEVTEDATRVCGVSWLGCTPTCVRTLLGRCCLPGCVMGPRVRQR